MPASGPIGEERRVALMNRLIATLGEEEARTLMESLPPVGWVYTGTESSGHSTNRVCTSRTVR